MAAEKDARRDVKKTGLIIVVGGFAAIAFTFILLSWLNAPPPAVTHIRVEKTADGTGKATAESPQYQTLLRENNAEGAKQAMANNTSFIASAGSGTVRQVPPISQEVLPLAPRAQNPLPPPQHVPAPSLDPERKKALEALLKELVAQRGAPVGQLASVTGQAPGQTAGVPGAAAASPFSGWTDSLFPATQTGNVAGSGLTVADRIVIPVGSRPGGVIETAIDSDNTGSQVLARIPAGPYAGATLTANGVQLAGDGVSIHFTSMDWNKNTWRIDAWAAMPDTLQSSVSSSVNNRYASRILLPALAHGLGLGGQLYASANTQILNNGYNTIEGRVGMPDGKAVAGTILGGTAQQAGQVISQDAQKLPIKQVLVNRGQSIAVLFMTAVKESDKVIKTRDEPAAVRLQPASRMVPALHP
ncbi:intracellular multiplication protein IcmE [Serratia fonticola]|uniref:Intracellular multiplication protein IcmE n=1 Tax=Serratia fonticola TaxID=47917 RepID=A0A542CRY4_SERFO|nr:conjugal transfer protein TraO [Serratia fonticola]TQI77291.1 intracellular multiplication protein IcmE [Serratia fonticola]TQI93583.1 intracellular multiplication protein IcmE [Serratia fonticola]TVZ61612.1 intracellular multiplication protein IcmE [Serratia fonticola]